MIKKTSRTEISRLPNRGSYNKDDIYSILDEALFCTVSYSVNNEPYSIPTGYVREDNILYIHGSVKSHFLQQLLQCEPVCITASIMDGFVLAKSGLHHSFNYRSVVLFSAPELVRNQNKKQNVFKIFTDRYVPGRWEDIRKPSEEEIRATTVIGFEISEASAKSRSGPPSDSARDKNLSVWSGELPCRIQYGKPIPDENTGEAIEIPEYLNQMINQPHKDK